jgi:hypothetical protein
MAEHDPRRVIDPSPGLAGGPPPAPPGFSDGTLHPTRASPETPDTPETPAPTPGNEVDGEGALTPRETGTPGGVPRGG